ncbi:MAG TPA: hypothetical protein VEO18_08360 [Thermoplasmata archaeon]|nr:hypothetical protein [Thermoplasmata archaeon]
MAGVGKGDRLVGAALLFVAAALHVVAAFDPMHMQKPLFLTFFWTVVVAQSIGGLAILRGGFAIAAVVTAMNVFLILAFIATRSVPVPGEAMPEPIEVLGVITSAVEAATLPFLIRIVRFRARPLVPGRPTEAL